MSVSPILGLLVAAAVLFFGVLNTGSGHVFLDAHAALIVMGGTLAATLISFPIKTLLSLIVVFFRRLLGSKGKRQKQIIRESLNLVKGYRNDPSFLKNSAGRIKDHFLKEGVQLINEGGLDLDQIMIILTKRAKTHQKRYQSEANIFKTISKFPPAFGLLGAVVGLIELMGGIGSEEALKQIGPAMAVAMVATFYGIGLSNFVFLPIAENLKSGTEEDSECRKIAIEAVKHIYKKDHPIYVQETLVSYALPSDREKLKEMKSAA